MLRQPEEQLKNESGYWPKSDSENLQARKGGGFTCSHAEIYEIIENWQISKLRKAPRKRKEKKKRKKLRKIRDSLPREFNDLISTKTRFFSHRFRDQDNQKEKKDECFYGIFTFSRSTENDGIIEPRTSKIRGIVKKIRGKERTDSWRRESDNLFKTEEEAERKRRRRGPFFFSMNSELIF